MIAINSKFVKDLIIGDVIVSIDGISGIGPVLHYVNGNPMVHHGEVVELLAGWETSTIFDPLLQNQEPHDAESRQYSYRERVEYQVRATNAQPNAEKQFPSYTVRVAGFENGNRLDQLPAEYTLRAMEIVQVVEGVEIGKLLDEMRSADLTEKTQ